MPKQLRERKPPTGLSRILFRAPIWLYRRGLGWLLGKRFLLINHIGWKSGLLLTWPWQTSMPMWLWPVLRLACGWWMFQTPAHRPRLGSTSQTRLVGRGRWP